MPTKLFDGSPLDSEVLRHTATPGRPEKPRPPPLTPTAVGLAFVESRIAKHMPSAPVPPPICAVKCACRLAVGTTAELNADPAWNAVADVSTRSVPFMAAALLYDQPAPPGGGTVPGGGGGGGGVVDPLVMVTLRTVWISVLSPVLPLKA